MLLLSTDTLQLYGLNRIFHFAKKMRYDGIELCVSDVADTRNLDYLRELQKQYDLPIRSLVVPRNSNIEKTKFVVEMADALNIGIVVVSSPLWTDFNYTQWIRRNISKFSAVSNRAICVENPPQGDGILLPKYALGNINELATFKNMSLDTANLFSRALDLMRVFEKFKPYIKHVRLADTRRGHRHLEPGTGVLPLESFLSHLKKNKYKGDIAIKVDYKVIKGGDDPKVEKALNRCRHFYEKFFLGI